MCNLWRTMQFLHTVVFATQRPLEALLLGRGDHSVVALPPLRYSVTTSSPGAAEGNAAMVSSSQPTAITGGIIMRRYHQDGGVTGNPIAAGDPPISTTLGALHREQPEERERPLSVPQGRLVTLPQASICNHLSQPPAFNTALVITPPRAMWDAINVWRQALPDKAFPRWMPHVTLLFPFVDPSDFGTAAKALKLAFETNTWLSTFNITLSKVGSFSGGKSSVVYLTPEEDPVTVGTADASVLTELQSLCQSMFPQCSRDASGSEEPFAPHVTLGQCSRERLEATVNRIQSSWTSQTFSVGEVHLIAHLRGTVGYSIQQTIPFPKAKSVGAAPSERLAPPRPIPSSPSAVIQPSLAAPSARLTQLPSPCFGPSTVMTSLAALVIIPPRTKDLWGPYVNLRKAHMSPKVTRTPYPRIVIASPFATARSEPRLREVMASVVSIIDPFSVSLAKIGCSDVAGRQTLFLDPQPVGRGESALPLRQLHDLVTAATKNVSAAAGDLGKGGPDHGPDGFSPVIELGFLRDAKQARQLQTAYQNNWRPVAFDVRHLFVVERASTADPWTVTCTIPLRGVAPGEPASVPVGTSSECPEFLDKAAW